VTWLLDVSVLGRSFEPSFAPRFHGRKKRSGESFVDEEKIFDALAFAGEDGGTVASIHRAVEVGVGFDKAGGHR
jgi:hypothetical protein